MKASIDHWGRADLLPKNGWLDDYERTARLAPGLLALLSGAVGIVALGIAAQAVVAFLAAVASTVGGPLLLSSTVRMHGLALQERLFAKWGGSPTLTLLRHAGPKTTTRRRELRRKQVSSALRDTLPTAAEEQADPAGADAVYESVVARMRELTRDRNKFPLVYAENKAYGFERNLLGARRMGIWTAAITLVALVIGATGDKAHLFKISLTAAIIGIVAVVGLLLLWLCLPGEERVRRAGDRYAERLLDSVVMLEQRSEP